MARYQRGSLRKEYRKDGPTWVLRFYATRETDGARVERTLPIGLVRELPRAHNAWAEVERQQVLAQINNQPHYRGRMSFADLANHYAEHELPKRACSTQYLHRHVTVDYLIPRWGRCLSGSIKPLDIEKWLGALATEGLANPTRAKLKSVMHRIYQHAQKHELVPQGRNPAALVTCPAGSDFEPVILAPNQALLLVNSFPQLERTLTLLTAATGLRISECLGLQWQDVDFAHQKIEIRRTFLMGYVGRSKSRASRKPVPLSPLLAEIMRQWRAETVHGRPADWVFPSLKLKGAKPRTGSTLAADYVRKAAIELRIIPANYNRRFGFHNLRHSLATFLVNQKHDPKTVQTLLRHANVSTTLDLYAHGIDEARLAAQQQVMEKMFSGTGCGAIQ
jgi:integrase